MEQLSFEFELSKRNVLTKPFLKWAGGKSQLLDQFSTLFPKKFQNYCEPFVGSAAVYWHLYNLRNIRKVSFERVRLTDSNSELINCYMSIRDHANQVIELLTFHKMQHEQNYYYMIRGLNANSLTPTERAARFIYLNKTCFNGLYRVNRSGQFNVPIGSYTNPNIFDSQELIQASLALQNVELQVSDFRETLNWARENDFIYFDPPYAPISKTSSFTSYTENPFGENEQKELAKVFRRLSECGCKLMLSNSWIEPILKLYKDFHCIKVQASRAINSNPDRRGKINELLVVNYDPGR